MLKRHTALEIAVYPHTRSVNGKPGGIKLSMGRGFSATIRVADHLLEGWTPLKILFGIKKGSL
jgi:hypothetical protein